MFRHLFLVVAVLAAAVCVGNQSAEARGCYRGGSGYGGGHSGYYRSARHYDYAPSYYGGHHRRHSYYYHGGHGGHGYHHGGHSGISLSFGF